MRLRILATLLAATATACAAPSPGAGPHLDPMEVRSPLLSARIEGGALRLENHTTEPLYYLAYREGVLAQFALCLGPQCPAVPEGGVVTVLLDQLTGWDATAETVHVDYWRLLTDDEGFRADSVRTLLVSR